MPKTNQAHAEIEATLNSSSLFAYQTKSLAHRVVNEWIRRRDIAGKAATGTLLFPIALAIETVCCLARASDGDCCSASNCQIFTCLSSMMESSNTNWGSLSSRYTLDLNKLQRKIKACGDNASLAQLLAKHPKLWAGVKQRLSGTKEAFEAVLNKLNGTQAPHLFKDKKATLRQLAQEALGLYKGNGDNKLSHCVAKLNSIVHTCARTPIYHELSQAAKKFRDYVDAQRVRVDAQLSSDYNEGTALLDQFLPQNYPSRT